MLKAAATGIFVGGCLGGLWSYVSHSMTKIEDEARFVQIKAIRSHHNPDLFQSFCEINKEMRDAPSKEAFAKLSHTLNRLLTIEKHINDLPRHSYWLGQSIEYKFHINRLLMFIKIRNRHLSDIEKHTKIIKEVAANACHNVRLETETQRETLY